MCNCKCNPHEAALLPEVDLMLQEPKRSAYRRHRYPYEREYETHGGVATPTPSSLHLYDTDLNAPCFAGNFNFMYDAIANRAVATFNTDVSFKAGVPVREKSNIIRRLKEAASYWDNAAALEIKDKTGNYSRRVNLGFQLQTVTDPKYSNKRTSVHPDGSKASFLMQKDREMVALEMHIFTSSTPLEIAHELGHIWGLKDEYKDSGTVGWITMKLSPCHVGTGSPILNDTTAIMNDGNEFRTRYFAHFGRAILNTYWNMPDYIIPVVQNGQVLAKTIQGRIRLLKKTVTGGTPNTADRPLNPQFGVIQVAKR